MPPAALISSTASDGAAIDADAGRRTGPGQGRQVADLDGLVLGDGRSGQTAGQRRGADGGSGQDFATCNRHIIPSHGICLCKQHSRWTRAVKVERLPQRNKYRLNSRHDSAYRHRRLLRRRRFPLLSDHLRRRRGAARGPCPSRSLDAHAVARRLHGAHLPRRLAARGRADAGIGGQARQGRRRFPDLPRQHHPSGPAPCPAALAAALAAHRRGRRGGGGRARLPPHRHHGHALAGRQRGLSGEAFGARPGVSPPEPGRARGVQPHHHGRAGLQHLQAGVDRLLPAGHRSPEGPGLRCRRAGLHRDPADHRRCELAPAHPRFDAPAGASGAPSRRAGQGDGSAVAA